MPDNILQRTEIIYFILEQICQYITHSVLLSIVFFRF